MAANSKQGGLLILGVVVLLVVGGLIYNRCTATPEKEQESFTQKIDKLELLAEKLPMQRNSILEKIKEFQSDFDKAKPDIDKMRAVNSRVASYITEIEKASAPPPPPPTSAPPAALPPSTPSTSPSGFGGQ
ncbi:MAG: hypothetical protein RBU37_12015 [Myxococcota bacterium]|jgi:hypothetical protein|nr:hypothetical protein [Myxococcota bacterium]